MDNLKFAVEYVQHPNPALSLADKIDAPNGPFLCVYARTRDDIKFACHITNTNAIQYEKPFLMPDMVNETIIAHIAREIPDYTYDIHKDQIVMRIPVLPNKGLRLVFQKDLASMPDVQTRLARAEALIMRLTQSEVIEQHTIKMFDTDPEFKSTIAARYFEAAAVAENYFKPSPALHLGEYQGFRYTLYSSAYTHEPNKQTRATCARCNTIDEVKQAIANYKTHFDRVIDMKAIQPAVLIQPNARYLTPAQVAYIHRYIVGFMMLNHAMLIGRELTLEIRGEQLLSFQICRSTRPTFRDIPADNALLGLPFPTLTTMTLGTWHFDFRV